MPRKYSSVLFFIASVLCTSIFALILLNLSWPSGCGARLARHPASGRPSPRCLERLSEAIYEDMQAKQDEEMKQLNFDDFLHSEALQQSNTKKGNLKYIWDFVLPTNACPVKEKLGSEPGVGDNGKWVCGVRTLLQRRPCIVYSFGSNGETAFEEDLLSKAPHCEVHVFDPTLQAAAREKVEALRGVAFYAYGLGGRDENVTVGGSRVMGRAGKHEMQLKTLDTVMRELGHRWLDVLKIDIEGAEWGVFQGLLAADAPLPFTQMQVEYHVLPPDKANKSEKRLTPRAMLHVMRALQDRNLRVFNVEPNYWWTNSGHACVEFAYVQVDKQGRIVTSPPKPTASIRRLAATRV